MTPDVIASAAADSSVSLAPGLRLYAIGDIHGRFDLLEQLASEIRRDLNESRPERTVEIFVGDYVDRGPESRQVVEWLATSQPLTDERICLRGNHEELLLGALDDVAAMPDWLFNGGGETLKSYDVKVEADGARMLLELQSAFHTALPPVHRAFIASLPRMVDFDPYLFVHAGIRPGVPIDAQDPEDLVWIRQPFLDSSWDFGRIVVHGHTPVERPDVRANRINIDTGAVFQGHLTCLVLEGRSRRFLQTILA
jgi:serine/threonine protein phosphatase 1